MAILVIILAPQTNLQLDIEKVLKMATIHDLAEIETGDIPTIHQTTAVVAQKTKDETRAFNKMRTMLGDTAGDELYTLWQEFEIQQTPEARFVKTIDKLECVIQKNQQSVATEPGAPGYFSNLAKLCAADPVLSELYSRVADDVKKRPQNK